jgi:hypothetical protein
MIFDETMGGRLEARQALLDELPSELLPITGLKLSDLIAANGKFTDKLIQLRMYDRGHEDRSEQEYIQKYLSILPPQITKQIVLPSKVEGAMASAKAVLKKFNLLPDEQNPTKQQQRVAAVNHLFPTDVTEEQSKKKTTHWNFQNFNTAQHEKQRALKKQNDKCRNSSTGDNDDVHAESSSDEEDTKRTRKKRKNSVSAAEQQKISELESENKTKQQVIAALQQALAQKRDEPSYTGRGDNTYRRGRGGFRGHGRGGLRGGRLHGRKPCGKCNTLGHHHSECPELKRGDGSRILFCGYCKLTNSHHIERCPELSGNKNSKVQCFQCQQYGHYARECPRNAKN